jgi:hypothetical protein
VPRDPRKPGDQRRLIDVTPVEMLGTRQVVQRIAKIAIACCGEQMQRKINERDYRSYEPPCSRRKLLAV